MDEHEAATPVSRETPPAPDRARGVFRAERLALAERYASWLADAGVVRGLIGPREAPRLWDRHLLNCAALAELLPQGASVCDVGSGAGLPGLVVAVARPDLQVTLVEPLLRRTTFLEEVVEDLGLADQVRVHRGRADSLHGVERFDVVTSRAVAPVARLLEWSMPLVRDTGALLALKGGSVTEELLDAAPVLARLGCADPEVVTVGRTLDAETQVLRVAWADPSSVVWPPRPVRASGPGRSGRGRRKRGGSPGR